MFQVVVDGCMFVYDHMTILFHILQCFLGKNPNSLHLAYKTLHDQNVVYVAISSLVTYLLYKYYKLDICIYV